MRLALRGLTGALVDVHLWKMVLPLLAAPLVAALLIVVAARRSAGERGPNGAGPAERAALVAFVDSALASARSARAGRAEDAIGAQVRVRLGERRMRWPDGLLTQARTTTLRMDLPEARPERVDRLLVTDIGEWVRAAETLPERPSTIEVPVLLGRAVRSEGNRAAAGILGAASETTLGSVLVAFGFRRLEVFHDGALIEVRRLDGAAS